MTETINQIKDELARIIVKIAELLGLRSKISVELQALQDRFIAGEIDAQTLQAEQGKMKRAKRMREAGMFGSLIGKMCKAKLANAAQPLKLGGINKFADQGTFG